VKVKTLHDWDLSYKQAALLQNQLAGKVEFKPLKKKCELIAGLDCALSKDGRKIIACAVVLKRYKDGFDVLETKSAVRKTPMPYIPGLLSFRESPACLAAVEKLQNTPDVFIIDGQGIAHPRRLGLAAHLGLFFNKPTIGCAKSRLTGTFEQPPAAKGNFSWLKDNDEVIGAVVRTRNNVKPVFVSVGNKCLLADAVKIVLDCAVKFRLPEPTRFAHSQVSILRLKT